MSDAFLCGLFIIVVNAKVLDCMTQVIVGHYH